MGETEKMGTERDKTLLLNFWLWPWPTFTLSPISIIVHETRRIQNSCCMFVVQ